MTKHGCAVALATAALALARGARADRTVQMDVGELLNARAVTTLTAGKLEPWTVGVDGGGASDGYMTAAASKFHGDPPALRALPDDGVFPADARHPDVVLHFSNDAPATSQQTHYVRGAGTFSFAVPSAIYSKVFLFATSSEGSSSLHVGLTYADATSAVDLTVPDYYANLPASDAVLFNLATDLPKWTRDGTVAETNHHNLTGLEIHPTAGKTLTRIQVDKSAPGYFVFWGATGIAADVALDAGSDALDATPAEAAADAMNDAIGEGAGGTGGSGGVGGGGAAGTTGGANDDAGAGGRAGAGCEPRARATGPQDVGCSCRFGARQSQRPSLGFFSLLLGRLATARRGRREELNT